MPKYHPELNFICMYWGYVNIEVRNECNYNWMTLIEHVPEDLDYVPLMFMCRAFTKYCRYIDGYRVGYTPSQV